MCIGRMRFHNKSKGQRRGMRQATQENNNNGGDGDGSTWRMYSMMGEGLGEAQTQSVDRSRDGMSREIEGRSESGMGRVLWSRVLDREGGVRRGGGVTRYLLHVRRDMCCYWTSRTRRVVVGERRRAKTETDVAELVGECWG